MSSPAFRVFISGASSEFEAARAAIASDLRSRGIEVKFQQDFRQEAEADTTLRKLHDYIRDCSAVISLVGNRSGSVPPPAAVEPFADVLPDGIDRASYTQWEVFLSLRYGTRQTMRIVAFITAPQAIDRILDHLRRTAAARCRSRAPPRAARRARAAAGSTSA